MGNGSNSGGRLDGNRLASLSREKMLSTSPYLKEWFGQILLKMSAAVELTISL